MSRIQEFTVLVWRMFADRPIEQTLFSVCGVGFVATIGIIRWRANVLSSRRLNAAIAAYTTLTLSQ